MSFKSAQLFVDEMKMNNDFRNLVSCVENEKSLMVLVKEKGFDFDKKDLVRAMADCMAGMEEMMGKQNK